MSRRFLTSRLVLVLLGAVAAASLMITGCDTNRQPSSSGGTGGTVSLGQPSATPAVFNQGSTTIVEVIATDADGDPLAGVTVTFGVLPATGGNFTPPSDVTDANGIAASVFTAVQSGSLQLYGAAGTVTSSYCNVNINSGGTQTNGNLTMAITPSLLTADGSSSAVVTVTVDDADGNPAPDSTVVRLAAGERFVDVDGNGYWSINTDTLKYDYNANDEWDGIGIIPAIAYVEDGMVTVNYIAGTAATTAYIKATVTGTTDYDGSVEASLLLTPNATINAIELSSNVSGVQVKGTGGSEVAQLKAICYDVKGNRVPEGLEVSFSILDGPGGGENINGQDVGPVQATTNSQGVATVQVWAGTFSGTIRVRASAGTVLSSATFISVYAGPPYYIAVGSDFCNIDGWNTVGRDQYIEAVVSDINHNPVQDSVVVYFTVDEGVIDAFGITQDSTGVAQAIFRTGAPQVDGVVWIWAETSGGTVIDSSMFFNSDVPAYVTLTISGQSLVADGKKEATVTVDVRDLNNNPVKDGSEVVADAIYGTALGGATSDGCYRSEFKGKYVSTLLEGDYSLTGLNDDGIGAIDTLTYTSESVSATIVCTLTTGFAYYKESEVWLDNALVTYGRANNVIRVLIKDEYGNPLGDHTVTAAITNGTITVASDETGATGEAVDLRFNAPADSTNGTSAVITITDTDPRGGGLVLTTDVTYKVQ